MEDAKLVEFSSSYFCFCVYCCFFTSTFLFQRAFYYFIGRYFFVEAYPFKNICQMGIFVTLYLPKERLLNK